ncbi:MAG TPA: hypothetical protein ENH82_06925 [bacterium]|nr:hypothetical protein [bacterium]
MEFRKTKPGVAICPFFTWMSENIEREGHTENDVSLIHCIHPKNPDLCEGNCQKDMCPLLKDKKISKKKSFAEESVLLAEELIEDFTFAGHPVCPGCGVYIDEDSHGENCIFSRLLDLKG